MDRPVVGASTVVVKVQRAGATPVDRAAVGIGHRRVEYLGGAPAHVHHPVAGDRQRAGDAAARPVERRLTRHQQAA